MAKPTARLSDGTTITIRTERTIAGTYFHEQPSRKRKAASFLLLGSSMFLLFGNDLVPISHPDYAYARDDKAGAQKALAFCVESAEATIAHAAQEGIPVEWCYTTERPAEPQAVSA